MRLRLAVVCRLTYQHAKARRGFVDVGSLSLSLSLMLHLSQPPSTLHRRLIDYLSISTSTAVTSSILLDVSKSAARREANGLPSVKLSFEAE